MSRTIQDDGYSDDELLDLLEIDQIDLDEEDRNPEGPYGADLLTECERSFLTGELWGAQR